MNDTTADMLPSDNAISIDSLSAQPGYITDQHKLDRLIERRLTGDDPVDSGWDWILQVEDAMLEEAMVCLTSKPGFDMGPVSRVLDQAFWTDNKPAVCRTARFLALAEPLNFWWTYHQIRNETDPEVQCRMLVRTARLRPEHISDLAVLLDVVGTTPERMAPCLTQMLATLDLHRHLKLHGWGGAILIENVANCMSREEALDIVNLFDKDSAPGEIRARLLRTYLKVLKQGPHDESSFYCGLSTSLVLQPISADAFTTSLDIANETIRLCPQDEITQSPLEFARSEKMVLDAGIDKDMSHWSIAQLLSPGWMNQDEIDTFMSAQPWLDLNAETLAPAETIPINGVRFWNKYNNDDLSKYGGQEADGDTLRQEVSRHRFENVTLTLDDHLLAVSNEDGAINRETSFGRANFLSGWRPPSTDDRYLDQKVASLALGFGDDNYAHFLMDRAPLLEHVLFDQPEDKLRTLLIESRLSNWLSQILDLLGVEAPIGELERETSYRLSDAMFFSQTQHPAGYFPKATRNFFARFQDRVETTGSRRIFIARPQGRRGLKNEAEIHALVETKGFEIVRLEELTMREQCTLFCNAEFVAGAHGAGFANIVFCKPGTRVLELSRAGYMTPAYSVSSRFLQMPYATLLDESPTLEAVDAGIKFEDLDIDPDKLSNIIDDLDSVSV